MRLRPLTERECYARCYGWRTREPVNFLDVGTPSQDRPPRPPEAPRPAAASAPPQGPALEVA